MYSIKAIQAFLEGKGGRMWLDVKKGILERATALSTDGTTVPVVAIESIMADKQTEEEFKRFAEKELSIPEPYKAVPETPTTLG